MARGLTGRGRNPSDAHRGVESERRGPPLSPSPRAGCSASGRFFRGRHKSPWGSKPEKPACGSTGRGPGGACPASWHPAAASVLTVLPPGLSQREAGSPHPLSSRPVPQLRLNSTPGSAWAHRCLPHLYSGAQLRASQRGFSENAAYRGEGPGWLSGLGER